MGVYWNVCLLYSVRSLCRVQSSTWCQRLDVNGFWWHLRNIYIFYLPVLIMIHGNLWAVSFMNCFSPCFWMSKHFQSGPCILLKWSYFTIMFSNEHTDVVLNVKHTCTDVWRAPEVWDHWGKKVQHKYFLFFSNYICLIINYIVGRIELQTLIFIQENFVHFINDIFLNPKTKVKHFFIC